MYLLQNGGKTGSEFRDFFTGILVALANHRQHTICEMETGRMELAACQKIPSDTTRSVNAIEKRHQLGT
jgi:hypothetical protein